MFRVVNSALPATGRKDPKGVPVSIIKRTGVNTGFAPISFIRLPNTNNPTTLVIPLYTGDSFEIVDVDESITAISYIGAGSDIFTPGDSLDTLEPGQFFFDANTQTVKIRKRTVRSLPPNTTVKIYKRSNELVDTDIETGLALPPLFYSLPIVGSFSWSLSFEQHPSASIEMLVDVNRIDLARSVFRPGAEYDFFGIGYRVVNFSDTEISTEDLPAGTFKISVSFQGKWEYYASKPVNYFKDTNLKANNKPFLDEECVLQLQSQGIKLKPNPNATTIADLAERTGVKLIAPDINVVIPANTPRNATTNWNTELEPHLRVLGSFVRYSDGDAVKVIKLEETNSHVILQDQIISKEITNTYQIQDTKFFTPSQTIDLMPPQPLEGGLLPTVLPTPNLPAIKAEDTSIVPSPSYPNTVITGRFSEIEERKLSGENNNAFQRPRYRRKPPRKVTLKEGDVNVETIPDNTTAIKTLDLNWDASGPTKSLRSTTTEDGSIVEDTTETWGFVYYASRDFSEDAEKGGIFVNPFVVWTRIKFERTVYIYSRDGWLTDIVKTGFNIARFIQETNNFETITSGSEDTAEARRVADLYKPFRVPLISRTAYFLKTYSTYYGNEEDASAYDQYKICNRDGTSSIAYSRNPNYVVPMFVKEEQTHVNSFAFAPNPESTIDSPLPPYTTGEESFYTRAVEIKNRRGFFTTDDDKKEEEKQNERYTEYTCNQSAQDGSYKNAAKQVMFKEYEGRPPLATRKNTVYELVDQEKKRPTKDYGFEFRLLTPGYTLNDPINGSVSYEKAVTREDALKAATTDLKINDINSSVDTNVTIKFNPSIKEGDKIKLYTNFFTYRRVVRGVSHKIEFGGTDEFGKPLIHAAETQLTLGIDRDIPVNMERVKVPKTTEPKTPKPPTLSGNSNRTLGGLLDASILTRRNF